MKTLNFLLILIITSTINIKAQPHIYFSTQIMDTNYGQLGKIVRYNLSSNSVEDFLPQEYLAENAWVVWDPTQTYIAINNYTGRPTIFDCSNNFNSYELNANFFRVPIDEILYSEQRNNLYIFSHDRTRISELNLTTGVITSEIDVTTFVGYNLLMEPKRNCFFSSNADSIYFYCLDTLTRSDQVWIYSIETNQITNKQSLLQLGGHAGSLGYSLTFGRNGKGIIQSYPVFYGNPDRDYYFKSYNFDADTSSPFIYHDGESEAYFNGNGDFTLILESFLDTLNDMEYYHTGLVKIYNTATGQLYKIINVPQGGIIYTFDNYPNDIYYVLNLETEPEIYNLTKLKLNSISPSIALPYISNVPVPLTTVTVNGEFFTDSSVVYYDGQAKETNYVSDSIITFQLYSSDMEIIDPHPVWVNNYGSVSDTLFFSVVETLPDIIMPIVDCVRANQDGTYTAYFGYDNQNSEVVFIPNSYNNYFSPYPEFRGQPEIFLPGAHNYVFNVDYEEKEITWTLTDNSVTASPDSTPCEE